MDIKVLLVSKVLQDHKVQQMGIKDIKGTKVLLALVIKVIKDIRVLLVLAHKVLLDQLELVVI